jgi:hypothetical protein
MQGWQPASILNARESHTATLLHSGRVLVHGGVEWIFPPGDPPPSPQIKFLPTADLYHPDTNEWIVTGSTHIPRFTHTATLLPDGSVLVVGGASGVGATAILETEIYNPVTQAWSFTNPLHFARSQHAATPLQDSRVLVVGGLGTSGILGSAEIFNPATQEWTDAGSLSNPRYDQFTATLLSDGRVLVVGGFTNITSPRFSAELFDPSAVPPWTPAEDLQSGSRFGHTATLLPNGEVLVAGGARVDDQTPLASCELFDPVTGHWVSTGSLNKPRMGHTATLLQSGIVMVAGGGLQTPEFFNSATGEWTEGPDMSIPRSGASQTVLRWDRHEPLVVNVLVAGGRDASSPGTNTLDSAELFTSGDVNV